MGNDRATELAKQIAKLNMKKDLAVNKYDSIKSRLAYLEELIIEVAAKGENLKLLIAVGVLGRTKRLINECINDTQNEGLILTATLLEEVIDAFLAERPIEGGK